MGTTDCECMTKNEKKIEKSVFQKPKIKKKKIQVSYKSTDMTFSMIVIEKSGKAQYV